jgi:hypothetical protein
VCRNRVLARMRPPDQDRQYQEKYEESPPRAEGERYADQHDECAGIHRMPHERIWIVTLNYQRH